MAVLIGLALGAVPQRLSRSDGLPSGEVMRLGAAAGLFAAGIAAAAAWLRTPEWAATTDLSSFGSSRSHRAGGDRSDHRTADANGGAPGDADCHRSRDVRLDTLARARHLRPWRSSVCWPTAFRPDRTMPAGWRPVS